MHAAKISEEICILSWTNQRLLTSGIQTKITKINLQGLCSGGTVASSPNFTMSQYCLLVRQFSSKNTEFEVEIPHSGGIWRQNQNFEQSRKCAAVSRKTSAARNFLHMTHAALKQTRNFHFNCFPNLLPTVL